MKMKIAILLLLTTAFFADSCSNKKSNKSDKFIGTWQGIKDKNYYFVISKEDTNFFLRIHMTGPDAKSGHEAFAKYFVTYNKEQDKIELITEAGKDDFGYEPASQHLLFNGKECQKIDEPPYFKQDAKTEDSLAAIRKANHSSTFEDDVIMMGYYRCKEQQLKAKDPSDEKAQQDLQALRKEMEAFRQEMSKKYADKKNDKEMNEKANKIMSDIMAKCK